MNIQLKRAHFSADSKPCLSGRCLDMKRWVSVSSIISCPTLNGRIWRWSLAFILPCLELDLIAADLHLMELSEKDTFYLLRMIWAKHHSTVCPLYLIHLAIRERSNTLYLALGLWEMVFETLQSELSPLPLYQSRNQCSPSQRVPCDSFCVKEKRWISPYWKSFVKLQEHFRTGTWPLPMDRKRSQHTNTTDYSSSGWHYQNTTKREWESCGEQAFPVYSLPTSLSCGQHICQWCSQMTSKPDHSQEESIWRSNGTDMQDGFMVMIASPETRLITGWFTSQLKDEADSSSKTFICTKFMASQTKNRRLLITVHITFQPPGPEGVDLLAHAL